jgi:hypothetical protein
LALYKDGVFVPELTEADLDEYLQDASRFSLRWIVIDEQKTAILEGVAKVLAQLGAAPESMDPLEAARGLVAGGFRPACLVAAHNALGREGARGA